MDSICSLLQWHLRRSVRTCPGVGGGWRGRRGWGDVQGDEGEWEVIARGGGMEVKVGAGAAFVKIENSRYFFPTMNVGVSLFFFSFFSS